MRDLVVNPGFEDVVVQRGARAMKFRGAEAGDFGRLVTESTRVIVRGEVEVAYVVLDEATVAPLLGACRSISYQETARTDGLVTESRTFGSLPRVTLRRDFCTQASMASQHPAEARVFAGFAAHATGAYAGLAPDRFAKQGATVSGVLPEWRIPGSVFTSGIVNRNNSLRYHHDAGNFPDLWSAMYAFSADITGGELVVPELRLAFSFQRPALILFNGARLLHGVTPIARRSSLAYRYSVVYYAMRAMCRCLPAAQELERIRNVKTRREIDRAAGKKV